MPATPEVVGAWLAAAGEGYAMPTLRRRVAAIARACGVAGHPLDTKHPAIRETLRGIGRRHGSPARRAAALTTTEIRKLSRACGVGLAGARDRALFLLGFAGALRRSELVGLDVGHVTWADNGLTLLLERSKTDKDGEGAEIVVPRGRADDTCPVVALKTWLEQAEITAGPLFRKVNCGGVVETARLSTDAVRQILLKPAAQAGVKGTLAEPISPHGLRAGFVTTAYRNWRAGRGDHGPHPPPKPHHDARLYPMGQAQRRQPGRKGRAVKGTVVNFGGARQPRPRNEDKTPECRHFHGWNRLRNQPDPQLRDSPHFLSCGVASMVVGSMPVRTAHQEQS